MRLVSLLPQTVMKFKELLQATVYSYMQDKAFNSEFNINVMLHFLFDIQYIFLLLRGPMEILYIPGGDREALNLGL